MPDQAREDARASEEVPLLRPLGKKWKDDKSRDGSPKKNYWTVFFGWLRHTLVHAFMFMVTSIVFMLGYHSTPRILTAVAMFLVFACLSDALYVYYVKRRVTKETIGFTICAFAIFAGAVVGTSIHLTKLVDYWPYYNKRHYTNVAPDEKAATRADASVLVFMEGARPDGSRTTAYRRGGVNYCVAPIALEAGYADDQAASPDVQYWAVGKDCCTGTKGFTCDDSLNPNARSGLVMSAKSDHDLLLEGVMSNDEYHYYEKAVLMTNAKFDLTSPKERMYVRFVYDIEKARSDYWAAAWWSWFKWQWYWAIVWAAVGVFTVVVGAGDSEDTNRYNDHMLDAKQYVLWQLNHYI
jgi:hypothetical protein